MSDLFLKSIQGQGGYIPPAPPRKVSDERRRKSKISEKYIGVILRHRKRGLSYMQIAKDLALPYHTVYNVVRRNLER